MVLICLTFSHSRSCYPPRCLVVAAILTASGLLHLFVPFSRFLWVLNYFLYSFWTPVWEWGIKLLTLPINLPKRLRHTAALRNEKPFRKKVRASSISLLSPTGASSGAHQLQQQQQIEKSRAPRAVDRHVPVDNQHHNDNDDDNDDEHGLDDIPALVHSNDDGAGSPSPPSSPGSQERARKKLGLEHAHSGAGAAAEEHHVLEEEWPVHPLLEKLLVPDGRNGNVQH